jgi:hypothetical protein
VTRSIRFTASPLSQRSFGDPQLAIEALLRVPPIAFNPKLQAGANGNTSTVAGQHHAQRRVQRRVALDQT